MSSYQIFILALVLSVDACIVSFSYGLTFKENRIRNACELAGFTGFFQGLMPALGYYLTFFVIDYIEPFANKIIFVIFLFLGFKFIKEACEKKDNKPLCIGVFCLFLIGIATSIDAFSAGILFALKKINIIKPVILITTVTFCNSCLGFWLGGKLQNLPTKFIEISAGIILILMGIKALF